GLVTVFWPAMTTGASELVLQTTGETRLVVHCKVNPAALVGQVKTIPLGGTPESEIVSWGGGRNPLRIVLLTVSATYTLPEESVATPSGLLNRAALPVPSALPPFPASPASVVTTPAGVILRIVVLSLSAT